jgi:anti-anti-sigma factor
MLIIKTTQAENTSTLRLEGIIDLTTYDILLSCIKTEMDNGATSFILDMEDVILLDSTGIGELYYFLSEHKVSVTLVNIPSFIQETLDMMGFFDALSQLLENGETAAAERVRGKGNAV